MQPVARRQGIVLDRLVSGTGAYVDPAFVNSGGVTHKSDVYSLGVVLFEVLCGRKAFVETSKHVVPEEMVHPTLSGVYDYIIREPMTHIQQDNLSILFTVNMFRSMQDLCSFMWKSSRSKLFLVD
ncbi:putative protein kinase RLK-Pelle-LRR-I-1 family [Helianthus annuus]|uniref:Protein kinase domain-containing protein n=1 Tax=Helianthus annuus TaxID=4232 RepID=A0A251TDM0_HELAN|nr:putative protein kinase RLK-Pelle-LRR-I-1 family [Helianthus annuus]KAJ0519067.1 putative protein kinase RLK-Pelle-LRR-I-1 family [Helianthus annuus]